MYIASLGTYNVEYNLELKFCEPGGGGGGVSFPTK
jgi:hypothetical protein